MANTKKVASLLEKKRKISKEIEDLQNESNHPKKYKNGNIKTVGIQLLRFFVNQFFQRVVNGTINFLFQ